MTMATKVKPASQLKRKIGSSFSRIEMRVPEWCLSRELKYFGRGPKLSAPFHRTAAGRITAITDTTGLRLYRAKQPRQYVGGKKQGKIFLNTLL